MHKMDFSPSLNIYIYTIHNNKIKTKYYGAQEIFETCRYAYDGVKARTSMYIQQKTSAF